MLKFSDAQTERQVVFMLIGVVVSGAHNRLEVAEEALKRLAELRDESNTPKEDS